MAWTCHECQEWRCSKCYDPDVCGCGSDGHDRSPNPMIHVKHEGGGR